MSEQESKEQIAQEWIEGLLRQANKELGVYVPSPERIYSSSDAIIRNSSYTVNQAPQFSGYIVLNARAIALDAPDKLMRRAIKLPFVPQVGTVLEITDGFSHEGNSYKYVSPVGFVLRVTELSWREDLERFHVRCEKIDGQGYERLADAVYWESFK